MSEHGTMEVERGTMASECGTMDDLIDILRVGLERQRERADFLEAVIKGYAPHVWHDVQRELVRRELIPVPVVESTAKEKSDE